jgi:hypothetical protein
VALFKALRELKQQSDQINASWDPAAQIADAQARMTEMSAMMAQQTAAANAATTGVEGRATVVAVRQGGGMVNHQPVIAVDLTVFPAGGLPYPATVKQVIPHTELVHARPGASVSVKIDPGDPSAVWIDWAHAR